MKNVRYVGLIGEIASGKTEGAKFLMNYWQGCADGKDIHHLSFSEKIDDMIFEETGMKNCPREFKQEFALQKIEELRGQGKSFTSALLDDLNDFALVGGVIISGIRTPEQLEECRQLIPNFTAVYIEADEHIRFERNNQRHKDSNRKPIDLETFRKKHRPDTERFIPDMKYFCDRVITNNTQWDGFTETLKLLV